MIKKEIRVLGIACAAQDPRCTCPIQVIGVVYRGNRWLEGVMRTTAPPRATDLTARIAKMIASSPHFPQLKVIALDELITKTGDYIDIRALSKKTSLPVIAVLRRKTRSVRFRKPPTRPSKRAVKQFAKLPSLNWRVAGKTLFVYSAGVEEIDLEELLEVCASEEGCPEAVRVARITAASLRKSLITRAPYLHVLRD